MDVIIEKLVYGGEGLARTAEGIVLVPGALPGESLSIELELPRRGVRRGRVIEITSPAPERVVPRCPYFADCGGCQHQQAEYTRQLEWKRSILQECFERIGKIQLPVPVEIISADPWEYRNRIRLHARKDPAGFQLGFEKPGSNEICSISRCDISSPALQRALATLATGRFLESAMSGSFEIELCVSDEDREMLATITASVPPAAGFAEQLQSEIASMESVSWATDTRQTQRAGVSARPIIWGRGGITMRVGDFHFRVSHGSFFQTNRYLLGKMIEVAVGDMQGERALDLFAGVGFFTLPLSRQFEHVVAVESQATAAADLRTNAGVALSKIHPYASTAEAFVSSRASRQPWDMVLVDPPRHGLATPVRGALMELKPRRIGYVSCDPTTLARDVAVLCNAGYGVASIHLIDLFPQTYHLEAIVHLSR